MGLVKDFELRQFEEEEERLDREFAEACSDLIAEGWDRETWEAFEAALDKDD